MRLWPKKIPPEVMRRIAENEYLRRAFEVERQRMCDRLGEPMLADDTDRLRENARHDLILKLLEKMHTLGAEVA